MNNKMEPHQYIEIDRIKKITSHEYAIIMKLIRSNIIPKLKIRPNYPQYLSNIKNYRYVYEFVELDSEYYTLSDFVHKKNYKLISEIRRLKEHIETLILSMHQSGIFHGNLIPENIIIDIEITQPKLINFEDGRFICFFDKLDLEYYSKKFFKTFSSVDELLEYEYRHWFDLLLDGFLLE